MKENEEKAGSIAEQKRRIRERYTGMLFLLFQGKIFIKESLKKE